MVRSDCQSHPFSLRLVRTHPEMQRVYPDRLRTSAQGKRSLFLLFVLRYLGRDEKTFGLEYDLDIFNIVAVSDLCALTRAIPAPAPRHLAPCHISHPFAPCLSVPCCVLYAPCCALCSVLCAVPCLRCGVPCARAVALTMTPWGCFGFCWLIRSNMGAMENKSLNIFNTAAGKPP